MNTALAPPSWQMTEFPDEVYYRLMTRLEKIRFFLYSPLGGNTHIYIKEFVHTYVRYNLLGQETFFRITERICPSCNKRLIESDSSSSFSDDDSSSFYDESSDD